MAIKNPVTESHRTRQQSALTETPRRGVVLHHGATTSATGIINMMVSGSRTVSSQRVIKDKRNAKVVDDGMRAWSLGSPYWDSVLRSIECANESTTGWTISRESHETMAAQVAYWAEQDNFWPHRNGAPETWTVFGHREIYGYFGDSYATACPGGMNINLVVNLAQALLKDSTPASGDTTPFPTTSEGADMPAVIKRTEGTAEWSLVWPSLVGPTPIERGYVTTSDPKRALWWERFYELGSGSADGFARDEYVAAQEFARLDHAAWLAGHPATSTPVVIDYAKLAAQIKIPTAADNGKAARDAIIK